ncbi:MAG: TIM barrel protein [Planctomycetota bacterium]|nr:TIM barrel protein [Planctomycetota bacterium]
MGVPPLSSSANFRRTVRAAVQANLSPAARVSAHLATTYRWEMPDAAQGFESASMQSMGVWRRKMEEFGEERTAELLRDQGIAVSSVSWAGGFTGERSVTLRESMWDACVALDWTAELGSPYLLAVTGPRAGHAKPHLKKLLTEELPKLGDHARQRGVAVLLQVLGGAQAMRWSCLESTSAALDLVAQCNHSRVGLAVDLKVLAREPAALARIDQLVDHMGLAIIREFPRSEIDPGAQGRATLSLREVVRRLEAAGYRGQYELQLPHNQIAPSHYGVLLRNCRARLTSWLQASERTTAQLS